YVLRGVPFVHELRAASRERVRNGQAIARTERAISLPARVRAGGYRTIPLMVGTLGAAPPHAAVTARREIGGGESAVLRRVPLGGDGGEARGQRVVARYLVPGAVRAA